MINNIPTVNYTHVPEGGNELFRTSFGSLSDEHWCDLLIRSVDSEIIQGVHFPRFPDSDFQNRIHGHSGAHSMKEAGRFYRFVRAFALSKSLVYPDGRLLDFGAGWGRMLRPFMRDFELKNIHGFEPNLLFCTLARSLNPYVAFLSGDFLPSDNLPKDFYNLVISWSVFSHLSPMSAKLWLRELSTVLRVGGRCAITTWGRRFLDQLLLDEQMAAEGSQIHWYAEVCIRSAGSIKERIEQYSRGEYVWFTSGKSLLYGEAFVAPTALRRIIDDERLPLKIEIFDDVSLPQDIFIIERQE